MSTLNPAREPGRSSFFKKLLKGLALSLGAGVMYRVGAHLNRAGAPVVERLNTAENRLAEIERSCTSSGPEALKEWIQSVDHRCATEIASLGERLTGFERHIPALINTAVDSRMADAETRIKTEIGEVHKLTLNALLDTVETRVAQGITHVEASLSAQSREIAELSQRMNQTDANLVRILAVVEGRNFAGLVEAAARG